ncbi:phage terminase small subunit [Pragia fontium]|uniref:Phage small terminase subunit n=1 Tax=Pragia fontium DSM 5563 = ATCC 49100 TaxID=1122977 RepID=A0AAJ4W9H2_9GAMM|nr:phage terminase small subunit [Pragia fontium]SFC49485.1 Phage small terminase subunit [Pragia fontium DSM 5563 = ATCC 49100]
MYMSPGQRHKARIEAEKALSQGKALSSPDSMHLQLNALDRDVARCRRQPNRAERRKMKRDELLPRWLPTVEQYLESAAVHINPTFVWCIVWLFDVGDFDRALDWVDIAIDQHQPAPANFKGTLASFTADTVLAWAENEFSLGHSVEPYFSRTFEQVRDNWRLHEKVSAKWFKFAGMLLLRDKDGKARASAVNDIETLEKADALLAEAHAFNPKVGVMTMRERIAARIRSLAETN